MGHSILHYTLCTLLTPPVPQLVIRGVPQTPIRLHSVYACGPPLNWLTRLILLLKRASLGPYSKLLGFRQGHLYLGLDPSAQRRLFDRWRGVHIELDLRLVLECLEEALGCHGVCFLVRVGREDALGETGHVFYIEAYSWPRGVKDPSSLNMALVPMCVSSGVRVFHEYRSTYGRASRPAHASVMNS